MGASDSEGDVEKGVVESLEGVLERGGVLLASLSVPSGHDPEDGL